MIISIVYFSVLGLRLRPGLGLWLGLGLELGLGLWFRGYG